MDRESIEERVRQIAGRYPQVEAAYIYGSFLKGEDYRDIDVALLFSPGLSPYQCLKLSLSIGSDPDLQIMPGRDFDVRVLNNAHLQFQYEVIKTGKAVFSRSRVEKCDYEAKVTSTYLDLKEMYDYCDRRYLAR